MGGGEQEEREHAGHSLRHRYLDPERPRDGPSVLHPGRHHHHGDENVRGGRRAGEILRSSVCEAIPTLETIYICDIDLPKAQKIAEEYKGKYEGVEIIASDDSKACAAKSELIMGETTARTPFIDKTWVKPHSAIVCVSNEANKDVALLADVKVVDYWKQMVTFKNKAIVQAFDAGEITKDQILETSDLALGKPVRTSDDQFIYACSLGLGALDITVAYKIYQNAVKMGLGSKVKMWDKPLWE